jgi:hypothetical protein
MRTNKGKKVQSFRHLGREDAMQAASEGLHLREIRSPTTNRITGYHGAPPGVTSKRGLEAWRENFAEKVRNGARYGRFWYDEAREGTAEMTRLHSDEVTRQVSLAEGIFSAGTTPNVQHGFAMRGWNQAQRGEAIHSGRFPTRQSETLRQVMEEGRTNIGPKTGPYGVTMNPAETMPHIPVTDLWMMRGLDYATEAPTEAQRAFVDGEMLRMVERMNAELPPGARQFSVPEVQASTWTYLKGADLAEKYPNSYRTLEEGMEEAAKSHSSFLDQTVIHNTQKTTPSAAGHLEGVTNDPEMQEWLEATNPTKSQGQDLLTAEAGLLQRDATPFQGERQGSYLPGTNVRTLGDKGKGVPGLLTPEFMEQVKGVEMLRGLIQGQEAVAGHRVASGVGTSAQTGVHIPMAGKATPKQMTELNKVAAEHGMFAVDTGEGVNFLSDPFSDIDLGSGEVLAALRPSGKKGADPFGKNFSLGERITDITGSEGSRRGMQSYYEPVYEGTEAGSGEATRRVLEQIDKTPGLAQKMDNSTVLKDIASGQLSINEVIEEGAKHGVARSDITTMLGILELKGLPGLRQALKDGVALPAIALFGLGIGMGGREQQGGG